MKGLGNIFDVVPAIIPVDLQTAANDGDWISLKNCAGVTVLVFKAAGTDNDDPVISFQQATDVAGTSAKALSTITTIYGKVGTLTAVGTWTKNTQAAGASYSPGDPSAQSQALWAIEIQADELDVDNGFDCIRVRIADTGSNAQLGCALYLPWGLRFAAAPENLPSAIVD